MYMRRIGKAWSFNDFIFSNSSYAHWKKIGRPAWVYTSYTVTTCVCVCVCIVFVDYLWEHTLVFPPSHPHPPPPLPPDKTLINTIIILWWSWTLELHLERLTSLAEKTGFEWPCFVKFSAFSFNSLLSFGPNVKTPVRLNKLAKTLSYTTTIFTVLSSDEWSMSLVWLQVSTSNPHFFSCTSKDMGVWVQPPLLPPPVKILLIIV